MKAKMGGEGKDGRYTIHHPPRQICALAKIEMKRGDRTKYVIPDSLEVRRDNEANTNIVAEKSSKPSPSIDSRSFVF